MSLNGTDVTKLTPQQLTDMFKSHTGRIVPTPVTTNVSFHGFTASKIRKRMKTVVTDSILPTLLVGTVITALNGILTCTLTPTELKTLFDGRVTIIEPTVEMISVTDNCPESDANYDAKNYAKTLDELTLFEICALCGEEGPPMESVPVAHCVDLLSNTNIDALYKQLTSCLHSEAAEHNQYDIAYAKEIENYLPGGLLRGESKICRTCHRTLRKNDVDSSNNDTPLNETSLKKLKKLPKDALINGLFPGHIPKELLELNPVEESMISIYSSITRVSLHGGKNYSTNGALSYTIVNDVTLVASKLPRLPSITSIAILRHANGKNCRDYIYRPYYVKKALEWLVANNHLYSEIQLEWPVEHDWDNIGTECSFPFLPLTDNDIEAIDENDSKNRVDSDVLKSGKLFQI
jgi:hypothetical protein